jgi:hypothetical protein
LSAWTHGVGLLLALAGTLYLWRISIGDTLEPLVVNPDRPRSRRAASDKA